MTTTDRRIRQGELFAALSLVDICFAVRASFRDGICGFDERRAIQAVDLLKLADATWSESCPEDVEIDGAVRAMVRATIRYAAKQTESP